VTARDFSNSDSDSNGKKAVFRIVSYCGILITYIRINDIMI